LVIRCRSRHPDLLIIRRHHYPRCPSFCVFIMPVKYFFRKIVASALPLPV
jgi:hypothetical protein